MSLADEILAADDLPREEATVPEWGVTVWVGTLMASDRDAYEAEMVDEDDELNRENFRARLLVRAMFDAPKGGNRIFRDQQATALGRKSSAVVSRLYEIASRLNAISKKDEEELIKNSEGGPAADSPTDSSDISKADATNADGT